MWPDLTYRVRLVCSQIWYMGLERCISGVSTQDYLHHMLILCGIQPVDQFCTTHPVHGAKRLGTNLRLNGGMTFIPFVAVGPLGSTKYEICGMRKRVSKKSDYVAQ